MEIRVSKPEIGTFVWELPKSMDGRLGSIFRAAGKQKEPSEEGACVTEIADIEVIQGLLSAFLNILVAVHGMEKERASTTTIKLICRAIDDIAQKAKVLNST